MIEIGRRVPGQSPHPVRACASPAARHPGHSAAGPGSPSRCGSPRAPAASIRTDSPTALELARKPACRRSRRLQKLPPVRGRRPRHRPRSFGAAPFGNARRAIAGSMSRLAAALVTASSVQPSNTAFSPTSSARRKRISASGVVSSMALKWRGAAFHASGPAAARRRSRRHRANRACSSARHRPIQPIVAEIAGWVSSARPTTSGDTSPMAKTSSP